MSKPLAACAGALLAAAASVALAQVGAPPAAPTPPPIPLYQVEIIVFAHRDFDASEERFADEAVPIVLGQGDSLRDVPVVAEPAPVTAAPPPVGLGLEPPPPVEDPLAFRILAPEQLQLGTEYRRIENLAAYHPLVHAGWIQPGLPDEQAQPFDLASVGVTNPSGTVRMYLSRYLHIDVDLTYRDGTRVAAPVPGDSELAELTFAPRYHLLAQRQARSGELHYFDHPAFGVLVKITPVPVDTGTPSAGGRPAA